MNLVPEANRQTVEDIPDWFAEPPAKESLLYAAGTAVSRDMQMAYQKAKVAARAEMAQQLGSRLSGLTRDYQEEMGREMDADLLTYFNTATREVTDEILVGARIDKKKLLAERGLYRAYVLIELPIGRANALLSAKLQADRDAYARLRAAEAFAELDAQLQDRP